MTEKEKRAYIKSAFQNYVRNKKKLEIINCPVLGGACSLRPSVVSDKSQNTVENTLIRYIDEKEEIERKIEIVKRTIEHYRIEDKKHGGEGKEKYIINRWINLHGYRSAAYRSHIAESTANYWIQEIFYTAQIIAEEYKLFP